MGREYWQEVLGWYPSLWITLGSSSEPPFPVTPLLATEGKQVPWRDSSGPLRCERGLNCPCSLHLSWPTTEGADRHYLLAVTVNILLSPQESPVKTLRGSWASCITDVTPLVQFLCPTPTPLTRCLCGTSHITDGIQPMQGNYSKRKAADIGITLLFPALSWGPYTVPDQIKLSFERNSPY